MGRGNAAAIDESESEGQEPEFTDQEYEEAVRPSMDEDLEKGINAQELIETMMAIWVVGKQQVLDRIARGEFGAPEDGLEWARTPPVLYLAGLDELTPENQTQLLHEIIVRWYLSKGFEDRLRRVAARPERMQIDGGAIGGRSRDRTGDDRVGASDAGEAREF